MTRQLIFIRINKGVVFIATKFSINKYKYSFFLKKLHNILKFIKNGQKI